MRKILSNIHFELRHLIILFIFLALFQILLSFIHSNSTSQLLTKALNVYRNDSAERIGDLTTSSLEFLLEQSLASPPELPGEIQKTIERFDIILSQQILQKNIEDISLIIATTDGLQYVTTGKQLYEIYFSQEQLTPNPVDSTTLKWYKIAEHDLVSSERIFSRLVEDGVFHILVPFVPHGNNSGAVYMRIAPDFSNLSNEITKAYDMSGALFSALILLGLLAMFYISSYTVQERNKAQQQLFNTREEQLRREIEHQKEAVFTKRIYHTHHKAEKVMGFITEDLRSLTSENLELIRSRVIRYAKFVSRVIYDMRPGTPPINIIRNTAFRTNINEVIKFIIENIFSRVYKPGDRITIEKDLDPNMPEVNVNENVVWAIIEPLIQNSFDHNRDSDLKITISSFINNDSSVQIIIRDSGKGFDPSLLETNSRGIKKIFMENISSLDKSQMRGFGTYIAYENCKRAGWKIDAVNRRSRGAKFIITIPLGN